MNKSSTITIRVDPDLKRKTEKTLDDLGLTTTQAVTIFLKQVVMQKGLPFPVSIPNAETRQAMENIANRRNVKTFENMETLISDLES
jgi:DNA-damage-inducible protein J